MEKLDDLVGIDPEEAADICAMLIGYAKQMHLETCGPMQGIPPNSHFAIDHIDHPTRL